MGGMLNWAFRDVFLLMIAVLILLVNPPEEEKINTEQISAQGQLIFEIAWETGLDVDVDIWVQPPGENYVSYLNKGTRSCNLLRDDVGHVEDEDSMWYDPANQEILVCRSPIADAEWVANVHYFQTEDEYGNERPLPVKVYYRVLLHTGISIDVKDMGSFTLNKEGDEHTMVRFKITGDGDMYGQNYQFKSLLVKPTTTTRPGAH